MAIATVVDQKIISCLKSKKSFLLDAGAGSGKTWTLVQALKYIIANRESYLLYQEQKIGCITYTNVAKDEIIDRIEHNSAVKVSTIHDFLWDCISQFQIELKVKLKEYVQEKLDKVNTDLVKNKPGTKIYDLNSEKRSKLEESIDELNHGQKTITYRQFPKYSNGIISHDDVIALSMKLFESYPRLRRIIVDSFPIIFIDEYQDTHKSTIEILLNYLQPTNRIILGFFGDKMQHIYEDGVGEIIADDKLEIIQKEENYRCSKNVIRLLNRIRPDLRQIPGDDKQTDGDCRCFISSVDTELEIDQFIGTQLKPMWKLTRTDDVKKLYLTHRLIAKANGYEELYSLYSQSADILTKNKDNRDRCPWIDFLFDTYKLLRLYKEERIQEFLSSTAYEMNSFEEKQNLVSIMTNLIKMESISNVNEFIRYVLNNQILFESERMHLYDFEDNDKKQRYTQLMSLPIGMFSALYKVIEEDTPFSTKHGTKGTEFDNVLVIIDDDAWRNYNFNKYFEEDRTNLQLFNRTRNLFYVVCSRSKQNLAILCLSTLSDQARSKLDNWFVDSIHDIE